MGAGSGAAVTAKGAGPGVERGAARAWPLVGRGHCRGGGAWPPRAGSRMQMKQPGLRGERRVRWEMESWGRRSSRGSPPRVRSHPRAGQRARGSHPPRYRRRRAQEFPQRRLPARSPPSRPHVPPGAAPRSLRAGGAGALRAAAQVGTGSVYCGRSREQRGETPGWAGLGVPRRPSASDLPSPEAPLARGAGAERGMAGGWGCTGEGHGGAGRAGFMLGGSCWGVSSSGGPRHWCWGAEEGLARGSQLLRME